MNDYNAGQIVKQLAQINTKLEALTQALSIARTNLAAPKESTEIGSSGEFPKTDHSEK